MVNSFSRGDGNVQIVGQRIVSGTPPRQSQGLAGKNGLGDPHGGPKGAIHAHDRAVLQSDVLSVVLLVWANARTR